MSTGRVDEWYSLLRNLQGAPTLEAIKSGKLKHVIESCKWHFRSWRPLYTDVIQDPFQKDVLFCEWSYFIDFEKRELETWDRELIDKISFDDLKDRGQGYMEGIEA